MGLDMYLKAHKYVGGWDHWPEDERNQLRAMLVALDFPQDLVAKGSPYATVDVSVCYWRKANAIHAWFVKNVQGGKDECQEAYVSREQLTALRDLCQQVLDTAEISEGQPVHAGTTLAGPDGPKEHFVEGRAILNGQAIQQLLPTQSGFFFGATDYDEWYLQDIEHTVEQLTRVLEETPDGWSFYYRSSW